MKQFVYQTILENRHEEYEKSDNPSKVTFKKPIFLNHNAIHQKANPNESNSPRKRPQTPLVHFVTQNDSADEGGDEEKLTPSIPQVEKQNFFKPEERKFIRRKSCCCQWCGGISSLETKHQDLVTDIESYGRKRLTQVDEPQAEPHSESPTRKSGLSALKQAVRRQKTLNSFFTAIKKENSKSQVLPDLALKVSKSSFPRNSPALNAIAKDSNKLLLSLRKSQDAKFEGKSGPSMKDPSLLDLGAAIQEYQPDDHHGRALKSRKKSEGVSMKLTSLKLLKNDDSPVSSKEKKDMKNLFKKKTRYSTTDLSAAYTLRQTYNMNVGPSTPTITKIALTSRAGNRDNGIFSSTQTSFPKSLNMNGKIVEEADCQSSYLESDREIRSALSDRIKIDSMTTRKSKVLEFVGPIQEMDNEFGLVRNGTNKFYDDVARRLSIKSKGLKSDPDLGYNSRDKNERIRSIYLDDKTSLLTSPTSKRNLVKIKSPHNASNKVQTLQDVQPNKLKITVKPKGRASEVKEFPKEFQISPLLSEAKKQKSGIKSRLKTSHLPTLTTDFSMFNKSLPQIQSATLAINKKAF